MNRIILLILVNVIISCSLKANDITFYSQDEFNRFNNLNKDDTLYLTLNFFELDSIPKQFFNCHVKKLKLNCIYGDGIKDFYTLYENKSMIEEIELINTNVNLKSFLNGMTNIITMTVIGSKVDFEEYHTLIANLKELYLHNCIVNHNSIAYLKNLTTLVLKNINPIYYSYFLSNLTHLEMLTIENTSIELKDSSFDNTKELKMLFLINNRLLNTTFSLEGLNNLEYLSIVNSPDLNYGKILDKFQGSNLIWLDLSDNALRKIPKKIFNFISLRELILQNNHISNISGEIIYLKNLEDLCIDNNDLKNINKNVSLLSKLNHLSIKFNEIKDFDFLSTSNIHTLQISGNDLSEQDIDSLNNLYRNKITIIY